jgi:hypothetical protein
MSMSDATEHATLLAHLVGTDLTYRLNGTLWIALFDDNAGAAADLESVDEHTNLHIHPM